MAIACKPALVVPEHRFDEDTLEATAKLFLGENFPRLGSILKMIKNAGVKQRFLVQPIEETLSHPGVKARNDLFISEVKRMGEAAAIEALKNANVDAEDIDLIITTSCTGFMIPSLDAYLIPKMGFRQSTKRVPITELGCAAGAVALSRAREFCKAYPGSKVLIVAAELCSLTFQPQDLSMQALVSGIIFGDGVAACVVRDDLECSGMQLEQNASHLFEDSWNYMGFDLKDTGFHIILDRGIPGAVDKQIAPVLKSFVSGAGLQPADLGFYCIHPGGRRVIDEIKKTFELEEKDVAASRACLAEVGNLSSASVLVVLKNLFERFRPEHEAKGLLAAFGPGFSAEMSLGTWYERP